MSRRKRQVTALLGLVMVMGVVSAAAFIGGISFELGRWFARRDTDNSLVPVEDWLQALGRERCA